MTAVVSYIYSTAGAGDLELLQWDAATLDGTVLFSNQLEPGWIDYDHSRSGYRSGAYLALTTLDPINNEYFADSLLKLDVTTGTVETLLTSQVGSLSGVACSLDGQKVFVFVNEGTGAKLLVSSDGGGTWVERSYGGLGTGSAWLLYDEAIGRLFVCGTSDGGWFAGYTDDEGVSWGRDFPDVTPISQWDPPSPRGLLLEGVIPVSGPGLGLGPDVVGLMDTQSLSVSPFATGGYVPWMRGFLDYDTYEDYRPFNGGPSISLPEPWQWAWAPSYVSTNQASVEVGEDRFRIIFENPDQTLCSAAATEDLFTGGLRYVFVSEIGEVPFVPFWRNLVGTSETP